jgi:hypothetical protein
LGERKSRKVESNSRQACICRWPHPVISEHSASNRDEHQRFRHVIKALVAAIRSRPSCGSLPNRSSANS